MIGPGKPAVKRNEAGRRCSHPYCSDCKTRRGNNRGNRRVRQVMKRLLRKGHHE